MPFVPASSQRSLRASVAEQIRHLREQIGQLETGRIILRRALDRQAGELDRFGAIAICGSSARRGRASEFWMLLSNRSMIL